MFLLKRWSRSLVRSVRRGHDRKSLPSTCRRVVGEVEVFDCNDNKSENNINGGDKNGDDDRRFFFFFFTSFNTRSTQPLRPSFFRPPTSSLYCRNRPGRFTTVGPVSEKGNKCVLCRHVYINLIRYDLSIFPLPSTV